MNKKLILAFSGRMGVGKSYLSQKIVKYLENNGKSASVVSFADSIRDAVLDLNPALELKEMSCFTRLKDILYEDGLTWTELKEDYPEIRKYLQFVGELARKANDRYWTDKLLNKLDGLLKTKDVVIIDDLRFDKEYLGLKTNLLFRNIGCGDGCSKLIWTYIDGNDEITNTHESESLTWESINNRHIPENMVKHIRLYRHPDLEDYLEKAKILEFLS